LKLKKLKEQINIFVKLKGPKDVFDLILTTSIFRIYKNYACVREKKFSEKLIIRKGYSVKEIDMILNILRLGQIVEFK